jgi:hypothetical protein
MARRIDPHEAERIMRDAGLEPLEPYPGAQKRWRCNCTKCGTQVEPALSSIKSGQGGCRTCAVLAASQRRRMTTEEASIVMLENGFQPLEEYPGNQTKWRCKCTTCGQEVLVLRNTVATNGTGCKHCWESRRGQALRVSEADAVAVMESAGLKPLEPYKRSGDPWRCIHIACGREVSPSYNSVQQGAGGCQKCGFLKTAAAIRHDAEFAADIMRSAGLEPLENYPGSKSKWRCLHLECGQEVLATFAGIRQGESGCFRCGAKKRGMASRANPEEARRFMIANGLEPQEPYELSNKPWKCIHRDCGTTVYPTYGSIQGGQRGCRKCADKSTGLRSSYTSEYAIDQAVSRGYQPLENYPGAMNHWRCVHIPCGREVMATLNTLMSGKGCCMDCGVASRAEKNRYTAEEAEQIMRRFGLEPLEPFPGYMEKWKCLHTECGREVTPTFWYVKFRESGCKFCATGGLDYTGQGTVYLLERQDFFSAKIGITTPNSRTDRIAAHVKEGWRLVQSWTTDTAFQAEEVEEDILSWWRNDLEAPISMRREDMKSGWTETASLLYIDIDETSIRIEKLISDFIVEDLKQSSTND